MRRNKSNLRWILKIVDCKKIYIFFFHSFFCKIYILKSVITYPNVKKKKVVKTSPKQNFIFVSKKIESWQVFFEHKKNRSFGKYRYLFVAVIYLYLKNKWAITYPKWRGFQTFFKKGEKYCYCFIHSKKFVFPKKNREMCESWKRKRKEEKCLNNMNKAVFFNKSNRRNEKKRKRKLYWQIFLTSSFNLRFFLLFARFFILGEKGEIFINDVKKKQKRNSLRN